MQDKQHKQNKISNDLVIEKSFLPVDPKAILREACLQTDLAAAQEGILRARDLGVDLNASLFMGDWTPLMQACWLDAFDVVNLLLDAGANPNVPGVDGTSLHIAARYSSPALVQKLLEKGGALVNTRREFGGDIALVEACRWRIDLDAPLVVKLLLLYHEPALSHASFAKAIYTACAHSTLDVLLALRDWNADEFIEVVSKSTCKSGKTGKTSTCLMGASCNRFDGARMVRFLLSQPDLSLYGDPNFTNEDGYSALRCACMYGNGDIVQVLLLACIPAVKRPFIDLHWVERNEGDALGILKAIYAHRKKENITSCVEMAAAGHATEDALWAFSLFGGVRRRSYDGQVERDAKLIFQCMRQVEQFAQHSQFGLLDNRNGSYLHVAARGGDLRIVQTLMEQNHSPFYVDHKKRWPVDVASSPEIRAALREYMKWKPLREVQAWFGPSFLKRVWTLLLVVNRFRSKFGLAVPSDIRKLLAEYVAKIEPVCIPWRDWSKAK